jgi:(2Fe-2S) ferredoxin
MGAKTFEQIGQPGARHHLFLCVGPDCCSPEKGLETWETVKAELKEHDIRALRTKAACLRLCHDGPWLVVYPEGIWYAEVTPERFARIRREHLQGGVPVQEWIRAINPLHAGARPEA